MLYFKTNLGSIPHITPRLLNDIDPEHKIGLYITYDILKYNIHTTLNEFINDNRKILVGPSTPQLTPLISKSDVKIRTKSGTLQLTKQTWKTFTSTYKVDIIAPNPHPQKLNVTRTTYQNFDKFEGIDWVYDAEWAEFSPAAPIFSDDLNLLKRLKSTEKYFFVESSLEDFNEAVQLKMNVICDINDFYTNKELMLCRSGVHFTRNAEFEACVDVLDSECQNECCQYSRAYLRHLLNCHELTGWVLSQVHNVGILMKKYYE